MKNISTIRNILSYWDRALFSLLCIYSIEHQLQILAIFCIILATFGLKRMREFVFAILSKIEQSEEGGLAGISWKTSQAAPLPKESSIPEQRSGISSEFYDYFRKASFILQQGDISGAKELFEKAEQLDPDNFEVHVSLGLIYDLTREYQKSIEHSRKALEIKPNSFVPQFNLAVAANHLYGADKSLPEYLEAEKLAKDAGMGDEITIGKLNLFLGHDYRDKQERNEALKRYERAKEIFRLYNTAEAHYWLGDANKNIRILEGK